MTLGAPTERRRRAVGVKALAAGLATILGLGLAEIAVRIVQPASRLVIQPGGLYEPDPPGRYRLRPGYSGRMTRAREFDIDVHINQLGVRGPEVGTSLGTFPAEASPGTSKAQTLQARGVQTEAVRLLALGDSFTFGVGVEDSETFSTLAAAALAETGRPALALNAGIPAFGVPDAVGWLARHGVELEPDLVLLSIFLGNDLVDASPNREEILVVDGLLAPKESPRGPGAWLHRNSHLYVLVKGFSEGPLVRPLRAKLGLGEPWRVRVLREELAIYDREAVSKLAPAAAATDGALGRLAELAAEGGFTVLVQLIPSDLEVDPGRWGRVLAELDLDPKRYDAAVPRHLVTELLANRGIDWVDPSAALAEGIAAGRRLYFPEDRHWTAEAHALAADLLAPAIEQALAGRVGGGVSQETGQSRDAGPDLEPLEPDLELDEGVDDGLGTKPNPGQDRSSESSL